MDLRRWMSSQTLRWQGVGLACALLAAAAGYVSAPWRMGLGAGKDLATASASAAASAAAAVLPSSTVAAPPAPVPTVPLRLAQNQIDGLWEVSIRPPAPGAAEPGPPAPEGWRVAGVYATEAGPAAIVVFDGVAPTQYLRVGSSLPNRAVIVAITRDAVTVKTLVNRRWVLVILDV